MLCVFFEEYPANMKWLRFVLLFLPLVSVLPQAKAQCNLPEGRRLERFYVDSAKTDSWREYQTDSAFAGYKSFIPDQHAFFDSLGVISFDSALAAGCRYSGFVTYLATLKVPGGTSNPYWELEGKQDVHFGGHRPGNATVKVEVMTIDAKTGAVLGTRMKKYRAMVDF